MSTKDAYMFLAGFQVTEGNQLLAEVFFTSVLLLL